MLRQNRGGARRKKGENKARGKRFDEYGARI